MSDENPVSPFRAPLESYQLARSLQGENAIYRTSADENGNYRLVGLPRAKGNRLLFRPPADLPYIPLVHGVTPGGPLEESVLDVGLERGVWADVRARDKLSLKPVTGSVGYFVLPEGWPKNTGVDEAKTRYAEAYKDFQPVGADGTLRFVATRKPAIVGFRADSPDYPTIPATSTINSVIRPVNYMAIMDLDPAPAASSVNVDFLLDAGLEVSGVLRDPDNRPLTGVLVEGLRNDSMDGPEWPPLSTSEFKVTGLAPDRPRLVCFVHLEKRLAGSLIVRSQEPSNKTVMLKPWGAVSGRLLDAQGKPIKNVALQFTEPANIRSDQSASLDRGRYIEPPTPGRAGRLPSTNAEGGFNLERMIPGLKYNLEVVPKGGQQLEGSIFVDLVFQPGEVKDLGDVTLKPSSQE